MSNAVTSTGILIKRGALIPPASVAITSNAVSAPAGALTSVVTAAAPHGLSVGDEVTIAGATGGTPSINGAKTVVAVADATHFTVSVPVTITVGGTGGTVVQGYQTIGELTEVTPGGISRNKIETSTHNDGAESHILGILRHTDPGMKINYVGSEPTHVAIIADLLNNVKNNWKILFPSGVSRTGQAYVQQFAFDSAPVDGKQGATLTLTWAGPVAEDAGV
jgi:hypothetical protein